VTPGRRAAIDVAVVHEDGTGSNGNRPGPLVDALASATGVTYGRLVPRAVAANGSAADDGWVGVDELLVDPVRLGPVLEASGRRFRSVDRELLSAQVARESVSALVAGAVHLWAEQRLLPDLTAANVMLREGDRSIQVGLRSLRAAVLPGDPLAAQPGVEVIEEAEMFTRLLDRVIGHPVASGAVPPGRSDRVAAVASVIATVRRVVRCGDRHLWGTAALAAGSALANASHTVGHRADRDRRALFAARADLARTVELVTVDDTLGGEITFPIRRTCCLLYKLPDRKQCGTCSLRDHDFCLTWSADHYREERRRHCT
jgi:hypothetical protein